MICRNPTAEYIRYVNILKSAFFLDGGQMPEYLICISIILWMMPFQFKAGSCRLFTITTSAHFITRCSDATNVDTFDARAIKIRDVPHYHGYKNSRPVL